jgi:hypothetical protein
MEYLKKPEMDDETLNSIIKRQLYILSVSLEEFSFVLELNKEVRIMIVEMINKSLTSNQSIKGAVNWVNVLQGEVISLFASLKVVLDSGNDISVSMLYHILDTYLYPKVTGTIHTVH